MLKFSIGLNGTYLKLLSPARQENRMKEVLKCATYLWCSGVIVEWSVNVVVKIEVKCVSVVVEKVNW